MTRFRSTLDGALDGTPGLVSVSLGRLGAPPAYTRLPDEPHYAASTMKVAVLVALYRAGDAGTLDLDAPVPVVNDFASALGDGSRYADDPGYDNEREVWDRLGAAAPARWLARRMIVRSSNLATNLLIALVGLPAVAEAWRLAGATGSVTGRGIEDRAAHAAGIDNTVTAADLARLLGAIATGSIAGPRACAEMLDVLAAQEQREDLAAGLPDGVRVEHKNGWIPGVRHGAGVVRPGDTPPYVIAVCTTGEPDGDDDARRLITRVSRIAWDARKELTR
ncbi:serine hydrolase [Dactylosporangium roseum]|uniref:Serine hydrolase n=1 Tax=Dactylosporangium roseum TaxID=47989 RepID=A0ABY5ZAP7_9ACTN|nr:serine hydrolase [Dactylosporangium roseum]UWZ38942.1 serine hydrolase [Dactylosporangium roseum]